MRLLITLLIASITISFADVFREGSLQGRSDGNNVIVQWGSKDESLVKEYKIERRSGTTGEFITIGIVRKKGSNSYYEYIDRTAFKSTGSIYQYRIHCVSFSGGAEISSIITISHNVSSVKRTWGSLKAMFR
ncbi:MAG: hypothetical protein WCW35_01170 [Bacteroidota bacterium]